MQHYPLLEELFYINNQVRVEFYDELSNKRRYQTLVKSYDGNLLRLMLTELHGESPAAIKTGAEIALICHYQNEPTSYFFTTQVLSEPSDESFFLEVSRPTKIQIASRRNFFRCNVNLPFNYSHDEQEIPGKVTNLSACGLFAVVKPDENLRLGLVIHAQMLLPTIPQPLKLEGKIVRMESLDKGARQGIAINFENNTENLQNKITKYLFQRQRELINHGQIKAIKY